MSSRDRDLADNLAQFGLLRSDGAGGFEPSAPNLLSVGGNTVLTGEGETLIMRGKNPTRSFAPVNNIIDPASYGAGTQIVSMATAVLSGVTGTVAKATDQPFATASGSSIKTSFAGNGLEVFDLTVAAPLSAGNKWIGFWAQRNGVNSANGRIPIPAQIYFTANGFSSFTAVAVNIYPGLHYYVIPLPYGGIPSAFGSGMPIPGVATTIRVRFQAIGGPNEATFVNNAGATVNNYPLNGDVVWIGDFEVDAPMGKAKFLVGFDDCKWDLVSPGTATVVDGNGDTKAHSYASFAATYGFPVNAFIITGAVGDQTRGYMDWLALMKARDEYGISYGAHSHTHPEQGDIGGAARGGLTLLGQYGYSLVGAVAQASTGTGLAYTPTQGNAGIVTDLDTCNSILSRHGLSDATRYLALPQGSYDIYVNQAIEQMGYRMVRGVSGQMGHQWAYNTYNIYGGEVLSPLINVGASVQTDGLLTQAQIEAYVDYVIATGAIGSNYAHSFGSQLASRQQTKWLFDYLAIKQAAGLIDVISMYEL